MAKYQIRYEWSEGASRMCWRAYDEKGNNLLNAVSFNSADECEAKLREVVASKLPPQIVKEIEL